ncbi:hypothetical protein WJX72_002131 [[Myrmecia] bisecta]|uniref:Uncharacterized protein n=1 Tax=[Myrmecia] bisecta TaxID=41462 RepID=A0AAW1QPE2_9CHLO
MEMKMAAQESWLAEQAGRRRVGSGAYGPADKKLVCWAEGPTWFEGTAADDGPNWWRKYLNWMKYRHTEGYLAGSQPFEGAVFATRGQVIFDAKSDFNKRVRILQHEEFRVLRLQQTLHSIAVVDTVNYLNPAAAPILPDKLVLGYIRAMVAAAAAFCALTSWGDADSCDLRLPGQSMLCIGVGGGSLPLFMARHFSNLHVWAVDIDPVVIRAAQQLMGMGGVPVQASHQQAGLIIEMADAQDVMSDLAERIHRGIARGQSAICMDTYDGDAGIPAHLAAPAFMQLCAACLHPQGTLVVNLFNGYALSTEREASMDFVANAHDFFSQVYTIKVADSPYNMIMAHRPAYLSTRAIMRAADEIGKQAGFEWDAQDEVRDVFITELDDMETVVELRA